MSKSKILLLLEEILSLLKERESKLLNATEAAQYLSISNSHLYKLTSRRKIPFHKPCGKYLYFYKNELDEWIKGYEKLRLEYEKNACLTMESDGTEDHVPENQMGLFEEEEDDEEETEPP